VLSKARGLSLDICPRTGLSRSLTVGTNSRTWSGGSIVTNMDERQRTDTREPLAADFIIPLMGCGLAAYYLATTTDLVWEARAAGVVVGVPLILMSLFHMGRTLYRIMQGRGSLSTGEMFANTVFNRQRLALVLLVALFIIALPYTGTTLGLFILLVASMWVLGVRSILSLVAVAGTTCAVVYVLLMYLLSSRLPQGPVEWLIGWALGIGS
jgi:hypothetical protein